MFQNADVGGSTFGSIRQYDDEVIIRNESSGYDVVKFDLGAGADSFVMDNTGKVGIGEDNPAATLHVKTGSSNTAHYDSDVDLLVQDGETRVQIMATDSGNQASALLLSNQTKHWVAQHRGAGDSNKFTIGYHASSASGEDTPGLDTKHFTILTGGNVGIGTTAPNEKLQVSGNINV